MSESAESGGKITKQLLKSRSGEFDIESIHSMVLEEMDISDLGCIGECTMLERLNLSRNDVTNLYALAGLISLTHLNLSANRITSLEGLQSLDNLQQLNVTGNLIGSLDCLKTLSGLEKLTDLRLKDTVRDLANPICMNNSYKSEVLKFLPNLQVLDGEILSGPGSELFKLCGELDKALKENVGSTKSSDLAESGPWVPSGFWAHPGSTNQTPELALLGDSEEQLEELLRQCKRETAAADDKFQTMTQTSPAANTTPS